MPRMRATSEDKNPDVDLISINQTIVREQSDVELVRDVRLTSMHRPTKGWFHYSSAMSAYAFCSLFILATNILISGLVFLDKILFYFSTDIMF